MAAFPGKPGKDDIRKVNYSDDGVAVIH